MDDADNRVQNLFRILLAHYGDPQWWPADDHFEMMIGAILTQNTQWTNVEKSIQALKENALCNAQALARVSSHKLAPLIRSSGYFNQKALRLIGFSNWYLGQGEYSGLDQLPTAEIRARLLAVNGIGPETADDILLYAFNRPVFVIDAYTRRIFSRLGLLEARSPYHDLQDFFHQTLPAETHCFQQYHALIVLHAKQFCRKKPACKGCPLAADCGSHEA